MYVQNIPCWIVGFPADTAWDQPTGVLKQVNCALERVCAPEGEAETTAKTRSKMSVHPCFFFELVSH
jgi:hypothetical protein